MEACLLNFVIDPTHRRVSKAKWQSIGARGEHGPHGELRTLSLSHARDKKKNLNSLIIDWCQAKL